MGSTQLNSKKRRMFLKMRREKKKERLRDLLDNKQANLSIIEI